jgi:hypothetical protein
MKILICLGITLLAVLSGCISANPAQPTAVAQPNPAIVATTSPTRSVTPTATTSAASLVGTWKTIIKANESSSAGVYSLAFKPDNTVELLETSSSIMLGTYTLNGDEVTFKSDFFAGTNCPNLVATYQWAIAGDQLSFTPRSENNCTGLKDTLTLHPLKRDTGLPQNRLDRGDYIPPRWV